MEHYDMPIEPGTYTTTGEKININIADGLIKTLKLDTTNLKDTDSGIKKAIVESMIGSVKAHGTRHNDGKLRWSLISWQAISCMVRVLMFGADKYGAQNWKKGLNIKEILDSLQRHVSALMDGELSDPESGMPHIGHVMCNCMFYAYFTLVKPENAKPDKP